MCSDKDTEYFRCLAGAGGVALIRSPVEDMATLE